ncbi:MAG: hypothetical protein WD696_21845 [Bryobacteraceae bacterium]
MRSYLPVVCVWCAASFAGVAAPALRAQEATSQSELIRALLERIDKLERRVSELESQAAPQPRAALPAPAPEPPREVVETIPASVLQIAGHQEHITAPGLRMSGFTDFNFSATDRQGDISGFNEGQFILHFTSPLTQKVTVFGEVSMTARRNAVTGASEFPVEVERAIVRFDQNDRLKISFGRYHTPINYWNTAFHHGLWLQTTTARPRMTQFGGVFIPNHFVGSLIEGALPAAGLNLNYNVGLGNGRGSLVGQAGDFGDNNNFRASLVNLFVKPDRFFGLRVGASAYRDKITLLGGREFREWITSGNIVWTKESPEFIAEFANVNHKPVDGGLSTNSQAWYVQAAYRLPGAANLWKPYYRYEHMRIPLADIPFQNFPPISGSVLGMRYDISQFVALKLEYRNQRTPGQPRMNGAFVQSSFTF